jgi:LacI family transcriptional regulator
MYFAPFINAFIDQVNKKDYHVLVSTIYSNDDFKKVENVFRSGRIDGGIFIGSRMVDNKYILSLIDEKFLIGIIDSDLREVKHKNAICANIDNIKGASEAIDYLVSLGHRDISIITGDLDKLSGIQRFEGSKNSLLKHGISINEEALAYGDFSEISGYIGMKKILAAGNMPTAVFICNDTMALGAYKALFEQKLKIPDDLSIISFDDIQISKYISPSLTTVNFSHVKMASQLSSALIDSVITNKVKLRNILIETKIIERESCKKIVNK